MLGRLARGPVLCPSSIVSRKCSSQTGPWPGSRILGYWEGDVAPPQSGIGHGVPSPPPAPPSGAIFPPGQYPGRPIGLGQPGMPAMPPPPQYTGAYGIRAPGLGMQPPLSGADGGFQPPRAPLQPERWQPQQQQQQQQHQQNPGHMNGQTDMSEPFVVLIDAFYRKGLLQEVDQIFRGIRSAQATVGVSTCRMLIDIYSQLGDFERTDAVYMELKKSMMKSVGHQHPEPTPYQKQEAENYFVGLMDSCFKKGLLQEVHHVYKAMKAAQLNITVPCYKILMEAYSQLGDFEKMDVVYVEMREAMKRMSAVRSPMAPPPRPRMVQQMMAPQFPVNTVRPQSPSGSAPPFWHGQQHGIPPPPPPPPHGAPMMHHQHPPGSPVLPHSGTPMHMMPPMMHGPPSPTSMHAAQQLQGMQPPPPPHGSPMMHHHPPGPHPMHMMPPPMMHGAPAAQQLQGMQPPPPIPPPQVQQQQQQQQQQPISQQQFEAAAAASPPTQIHDAPPVSAATPPVEAQAEGETTQEETDNVSTDEQQTASKEETESEQQHQDDFYDSDAVETMVTGDSNRLMESTG